MPVTPTRTPSQRLKNKNRVSATKPSPVQPSAAAASRDTDDLASVTSSPSSTSSRRLGIAISVQKQLAQDIEEAGGIKKFVGTELVAKQALSLLCNKRQNIYGERGDRIRTKIHKKVYSWKVYLLDGTYHDRVLNRLGVQSFATLQIEKKKGKQHIEVYSSDESSSSDDESTSSVESIPANISIQKTKVSISTPSPRKASSISTPSPSRSPITRMEFQRDTTPTPEGAGKSKVNIVRHFFAFFIHSHPLMSVS
jgi:hypothetical protein